MPARRPATSRPVPPQIQPRAKPAIVVRRPPRCHPQITVLPADRNVAVPVGAQHHGAHASQQRQRGRRRVPVVVACADAHQRHPGRQQMVQRGVLGRGTVVGHLEDVDRSRRHSAILDGAPQRLLSGVLHVARREHGHAGRPHEQYDAGVVGP